jgi:hypothetical protein
MPRQNRTLRTLRGGGTSSYTFNPASHLINNPIAWRSEDIHGGVRSMPSVASHGLPMQRGGGGASYGFVGPSGVAGGIAAHSPTHCQQLPVASLNTRGGELWRQGGGKRKTIKRNNNKRSRTNKNNKRNTNKNKRSNNKRN